MILSTVTDEVLPDRSSKAFPRIFETDVKAGVYNFEIRMVEAKRFPIVETKAWDRMKHYAAHYDITFSSVSPGLFKTSLHHDLMLLHRKYLLPMSMDLADSIGVKTLVTFGVLRCTEDTPEDFDEVISLLREAAEKAADRGFSIQLENLPGTWADTSDNCLKLLEAVNSPNLGYIWDTGNLYEAEPVHFMAGYQKLKPFIRNVHIKDGRFLNGSMQWQHFGDGQTDLKGQVETLLKDGYEGTITLEAKCEPQLDEDFPKSINYLKSVIQQYTK